MSHPSLGLPLSLGNGYPEGGRRIRAASGRLGVRALEVAVDADPRFREHVGETGMRLLVRDTEVYLERIARAVETGDVAHVREWVEWVVPVYRRRRVALDDVATLTEGLRAALGAVLSPDERVAAGAALDEAIRVLRWHRRLGGDAGKRNRLVNLFYKGA